MLVAMRESRHCSKILILLTVLVLLNTLPCYATPLSPDKHSFYMYLQSSSFSMLSFFGVFGFDDFTPVNFDLAGFLEENAWTVTASGTHRGAPFDINHVGTIGPDGSARFSIDGSYKGLPITGSGTTTFSEDASSTYQISIGPNSTS